MLCYLVPCRQIGVEIMLSVECGARLDLGIERNGCSHSQFYAFRVQGLRGHAWSASVRDTPVQQVRTGRVPGNAASYGDTRKFGGSASSAVHVSVFATTQYVFGTRFGTVPTREQLLPGFNLSMHPDPDDHSVSWPPGIVQRCPQLVGKSPSRRPCTSTQPRSDEHAQSTEDTAGRVV